MKCRLFFFKTIIPIGILLSSWAYSKDQFIPNSRYRTVSRCSQLRSSIGAQLQYGPRKVYRPSPDVQRPVESLKTISLLQWNLEDVSEFKKDSEDQWVHEKSEAQFKALSHVVGQTYPDLFLVHELSSLRAMDQLKSIYFHNQYVSLLIPGNDIGLNHRSGRTREVHTGLFVKRNMPFEIEIRSHRDLISEKTPEYNPLFVRDVPVFIFKNPRTQEPLFIIMGVHYKSLKDKFGRDPNGFNHRMAEVEATIFIYQQLVQEFSKKIPVLISGDFNNHVPTAYEFNIFRKMNFTDVLDINDFIESRTTYTMLLESNNPNKPTTSTFKSQLDATLQNLHSQRIGFVKSASLLPYIDESGKVLPPPKTREQRNKLISGHRPTRVELNIRALLE